MSPLSCLDEVGAFGDRPQVAVAEPGPQMDVCGQERAVDEHRLVVRQAAKDVDGSGPAVGPVFGDAPSSAVKVGGNGALGAAFVAHEAADVFQAGAVRDAGAEELGSVV